LEAGGHLRGGELMAGFSNSNVFADNVDFSGGFPVTAQVTADGELLIGSTVAPNIRVGTLTSTGGSVTITNGAGTINLEAGIGTPTTFMEDVGSATPAANILQINGTSTQGISTSGAGNIVTLTAANASSSQKGVASFNGTEFTVTSGAVASNPITVTAGSGISVTGSPVNLGGAVTIAAIAATPTTFTEDTGSATPAANNLNILGTSAQGIATSGTAATVTITAANATSTQKGVASFNASQFTVTTGAVAANPITVTAGTGISVTGSPVALGGAVTINATGSVPTTFTEDTGTATPSANNVNILGTSTQGISTSGTGATVTITAANASSSQKGVASFNGTNFTATAGAIGSNAMALTAGSNITLSTTSLNLGGALTISATATPFNIQTQSSMFEDFLGGSAVVGGPPAGVWDHAWNMLSTNNVYPVDSVAGHPGIVQLSSAAALSPFICLGTNTIGAYLLGNGTLSVKWCAQIPVLSSGAGRYNLQLGVSRDPINGSNSIRFFYTDNSNSGQWIIQCSLAGVSTAVNTVVAADTNWHTYEIQVNAAATSVSFLIDNVVVGTAITTNIPNTVAIFPYATMEYVSGSLELINIDFCSAIMIPTTPR
jgi:hypothetical protein